jgi:hypothetical protein
MAERTEKEQNYGKCFIFGQNRSMKEKEYYCFEQNKSGL